MFCFSYIPVVMILVLEINGQLNRDSLMMKPQDMYSNLIKKYKDEIEEVQKETYKMNFTKNEIAKSIKDLNEICPLEIRQLKQREDALVVNIEGIAKKAMELLKLIHKEEAEHFRLQSDMIRLSELLEVGEYQYYIVYHDLILMEVRKSDGTSESCLAVKAAMDELEKYKKTLEQRAQAYRSINPYKNKKPKNNSKREASLLEVKKDNVEQIYSQTVRSVDLLKTELQSSKDLCDFKKTKSNTLVVEAQIILTDSERHLKQLQSDLDNAQAFSNTVRLEIKQAEAFLKELKEKIKKAQNMLGKFKKDKDCYTLVEKMD